MPKYHIDFTESALDDIVFLKPYAQRIVFDKIDQQLLYEPNIETRNRKSLKENILAPWELRTGIYRIFYQIDLSEQIVVITAVGFKEHNTIFIRGEEYAL